MSDFRGLSLLIKRFTSDFDIAKKSLKFSTQWIDAKHRDGGRITAREYQEFLNELKKIENEVKP